MSATDITRYLTDEVVEEAARAAFDDGFMRYAPEHIARWGEEDDEGVRESWRVVARASLSAVLPGIIQQAKAEAWEEGAHAAWERSTSAVNGARYCWRHDGEPANPYRADRIEHDARCPHPKCPGGGLCCCLPEQGGQP